MLFKLFLLFVVVPIAELWLLLVIADYTSWQFTFVLVIITGFIGATLAKRQGLRTWQRVERELASGKMPGDAVVDAVLILIAGVVLLTPGVMTDLLGFGLLIPPIRSLIKKFLVRRYKNRISFHSNMNPMGSWNMNAGDPEDEDIIDSKFSEPSDRDEVIDSRVIDDQRKTEE